MNQAEDILKKLLTGDIWIYTEGVTGAGLDYSWVHLTEDEALYLKSLGADHDY